MKDWEKLGGGPTQGSERRIHTTGCAIKRTRVRKGGPWSSWTAEGRGDGWAFEKAGFWDERQACEFALAQQSVFAS